MNGQTDGRKGATLHSAPREGRVTGSNKPRQCESSSPCWWEGFEVWDHGEVRYDCDRTRDLSTADTWTTTQVASTGRLGVTLSYWCHITLSSQHPL